MQQSEPYLQRTSGLWFLIAVMLVGGLIFACAYIPKFADAKGVLLCLGPTIFGSALGSFFGILAAAKHEKKIERIDCRLDDFINDTLSRVFDFPWCTDENDLKTHRVVLHEYYLTRSDGEEFWMYHPIDFSKYLVPGRLYSRGTTSMEGVNYDYEYHGFLLNNRLVINIAPGHNEQPAICIYGDYCTMLHRDRGYAGINVHFDWNSHDGVDPCLISHNPLFNTNKPGRQEPDVCAKLMDRWIKMAPRVGLPERE